MPDLLLAPKIIDRTSNSIKIEWNQPQEARKITGFIVEYQIPPGREFSKFGGKIPQEEKKSVFSLFIDRLNPDTEIVVRIRAVGRNNKIGNPSPEARGSTLCAGKKCETRFEI